MSRWAASVLLVWLLAGCAAKEEAVERTSVPEAPTAPVASQPALPAANGRFDAINKALESGQFDHAAARLLEMRASGKEFGQNEAVEYREALEQAYAKALEAAQNGDPRGQATLQMIRAATAR